MTVISEQIYQALVRQSEKIGVFAHGFTYSRHPVAARGVETLKIYEEQDDHQMRAVASHCRLRRWLFHGRHGISADLDLNGQLQPHAGVKFVQITMEGALTARHDR